MTVRKLRSNATSLENGASDGKYRKRRPNVEVDPGMGDELVVKNRAGRAVGCVSVLTSNGSKVNATELLSAVRNNSRNARAGARSETIGL